MKIKTLLIIIVVTSILLVIGLIIYKKEPKKEEKVELIGTIYKKPIISKVTMNDNLLEITANNYMYGDINYDNHLNNDDLELYDLIIKNDFIIDYNQIVIGDLDKNNKIDDNDRDLLNNYLKEYQEKENKNQDQLLYCVNEEDNYNSCNWQENNKISINNNANIYVKNKQNNEVSDVYKYQYVVNLINPFPNDDK